MEDPEDLNYDCNYNLFLAKTLMNNLKSQQDRQKVTRWLRKLAGCNRSIDEMRLRNDFMYHLVLNIQGGELASPFNENPPAGPLTSLAHLLPGAAGAGAHGIQLDSTAGLWAGDWSKPSPERPMIYKYSPDGGAFLAAQPIPRCGAFCYLAVVTNSQNEEEAE